MTAPFAPATNRREWLKSAAACMATGTVAAWNTGVLDTAAPGLLAAPTVAPPRFQKAVKIGMVAGDEPLAKKFRLLRELGYDGVELDSPNGWSRDDVLRARDESGLPIHGVVDSVHWRDHLGHADSAVRARGLAALEVALRDASAYGASSVLLVPAVVGKEVSYAAAYGRSQAEIRKLLPLAAELKVTIALENVWNQFLLSPLETARYIDEFESPWVKAYFDVGNAVTYGWPEQWIRTLGPRIAKLDIKEFSRKKRDQEGPFAGFNVEIGEGDCDWPSVVQALADIGYSGWATAEVPGGDHARLAEIARRMDQVLVVPPRD